MAEVDVDFFSNSLGRPLDTGQCDLTYLSCTILKDSQAACLEGPVTNEVIFKTMKSMKKIKAPGPDGFTMKFFLATWDITRPLFRKAIIQFFHTSEMYKGVNSTSIALVPKNLFPHRYKRL